MKESAVYWDFENIHLSLCDQAVEHGSSGRYAALVESSQARPPSAALSAALCKPRLPKDRIQPSSAEWPDAELAVGT